MSDSVTYKGAAPPPAAPQQLAQRRRQRGLVLFTAAGVLIGGVSWQVVAYRNSAEQRAEGYLQAGRALLVPGGNEEAIRQLDRALAAFPNLAEAYYFRGVARLNLGQRAPAEADFKAALSINPQMSEAAVALAEMKRQAGEHGRAIEELTRIIETHPTVEAYHQRAAAYAELGQHDKAIADYTWIIDKVGDTPMIYWSRANSRRALGDLQGARQDEAMAELLDRSRDLLEPQK